jgi:hypothetical protein
VTNPLGKEAWGTRDYLDRIEELCERGDYATADASIVAALGTMIEWNGIRLYLPEFRWETVTWNGRGQTRGWTRRASEEDDDDS